MQFGLSARRDFYPTPRQYLQTYLGIYIPAVIWARSTLPHTLERDWSARRAAPRGLRTAPVTSVPR